MATKGIKALRGKKKIMFEALKNNLGNITIACTKIGISRQTHYLWLDKDPNYKEAVKHIDEISLDFAENALFKQIKAGVVPSTIFYLKTKGKKRGYVERQEIENVGDRDYKFIIELPDKKKIKGEKKDEDKK